MENQRTSKLRKKYHSTTIHFFIRSLLANGLLLLIPLLLVSAYSMFRTASESTAEASEKAYASLQRASSILESYYTHVDNTCLFLSSNPKVSRQLQKAFNEPSLSLESIRAIENISLSFQNQIYTNESLNSIYIYYTNEYGRIFSPLHSKILSFSDENEKRVLSYFNRVSEADAWMEFSDKPFLYTEYPSENLLICRRLSKRATGIQNGVVIYSFRADRLKKELDQLLSYKNQKLFLIDPRSRILWPSAEPISEDALFMLADPDHKTVSDKNGLILENNLGTWHADCLISPRSYGFSYLLMTPKTEIYATTIHLTSMYALITCISIAVAGILAWFKTRHDYKYLNRIISVFTEPESAVRQAPVSRSFQSGPFEFILMNVINLFIEQNYLRVQDSEKEARLQLWKIEALQHQINPHFLYNTLDMINWLAKSGQISQVSQAVQALTRFYRLTLGQKELFGTIDDEITHVTLYMQLQNMRYNHCADFIADIPPELGSLTIPKLTFQPIVENALLHGILMKEEKKGCILLTGWREGEDAVLVISDDGAGIAPEKLDTLLDSLSADNGLTSLRHIGVSNTNLRLKSLYGDAYGLSFTSTPGQGTEVTVRIPARPVSL